MEMHRAIALQEFTESPFTSKAATYLTVKQNAWLNHTQRGWKGVGRAPGTYFEAAEEILL